MKFHANLLKRFCEKSPKTTWWHGRNPSQSLQVWNFERWWAPATVPGRYLGLHFAVQTLWKKCAGWGSFVRLCPFNCYPETRSTLAEQGSEGFDWEFCLLCCLFCLFHVIDVQSHCIEDHRRSVNFIIEYHRWISSLNPILESQLWVSSLNPISEFHHWIPVVPHEAVAEVSKIWTIQERWNVLMSRCEGYQLSEARSLVSWSTWCNWSFWCAWLIYLSIYLSLCIWTVGAFGAIYLIDRSIYLPIWSFYLPLYRSDLSIYLISVLCKLI